MGKIIKKIIVDNFDMITHQELTLDTNLNIIIGPQASGKSTLVKLIFFCRKLRDYLLDYLGNPSNFQDIPPKRYMTNLNIYLRRRFLGCFGTTKRMKKFNVRFYFDVEQNRYVNLTRDTSGYLHITFESNMWKNIVGCLNQSGKTYQAVYSNQMLFSGGFSGDLEKYLDAFKQYMNAGTSARNYYIPILGNLFQDWDELIYIPAGRSVLSLLSDKQLEKQESAMSEMANNYTGNNGSDSSVMEPFQDFVKLIQSMKERFNMSLSEMIVYYQKMDANRHLNTRPALRAIPIIQRVLCAEYRKEIDGEKLYYTDTDYVKLMFASSGQQEVLWILNLIFLKILENKRIFLVLEEPEAHLFPVAQKNVVELIALLINSTDSSVFITTHSPYILTSANLYVYSAQVENNPKLKGRTDSVIPAYLRIFPEKYNAFMTPDKGQVRSEFLECIKEPEDNLIDATKIDEISDIITNETNRLIDLEIQYDL